MFHNSRHVTPNLSTTTPIDMLIRSLYYMNKYKSLRDDADYL
jgi:hypothetical protein